MYNQEYRHTSLIATLRKTWDLGAAFTQRDAAARTFDHIFTRENPRDPQAWATVAAQPVPAWAIDYETLGQALGHLGKDAGPGLIEHARQMGVKLPPQLDAPVRTHPAAHHRGHQGRRLPLLPQAGARRYRRWPLSQ